MVIQIMPVNKLFKVVKHALQENNLDSKITAVRAIVSQAAVLVEQQDLTQVDDIIPIGPPGRPITPKLVPPKALQQRKLNTIEGQAAMVHAIAHIEFNAINLALDAVYRFRALPAEYYIDWLRVAKEEAYHFSLLQERLHELGYSYGDFPAHNGLWELAEQTADDVMIRMGIVPRIMEARGLDVTPGISKKFASVGDQCMVEILQIIFQDEIGHVQLGNLWFKHVCLARGLEPLAVFQNLAQQYLGTQVKLPFHEEARLAAGFTQEELDFLQDFAQASCQKFPEKC